jgi:hydroxymethylpyrimidine pyrophosphatase-like HAD family hydrolase
VIEAYKDHPWKPEQASGEFWSNQDIYQLFLHCELEGEVSYQQDVPELNFMRWSRAGIRTCDVNASNGSKATGIEQLLRRLEIAPEEAVAFGDGLNDLEMLSMVGMGVAMGNARPEVQAYAKMVTGLAEEDGVKQGLQKLGLI